MISIYRLVLVACFACILPFSAFSEAPVVDDSENFALLEEQQGAYQPPVAHQERNIAYNEDQPALAKENQDTEGTGNNVALLNKIQGLQQDIQELRGQLEVQAHELKALQEQQLSFYNDLDARVRKAPVNAAKNQVTTDLSLGEKPVPASPAIPTATVETASPQAAAVVAPAIVPVAASRTSNPAEEQISYLAAYELVKSKKFDDALVSMQSFATKYPQGGYTANAQYWLGELYMVKKKYPEAIEHFEMVLQQFPSSSKCSASLLKIGYALAASGKTTEAKVRLQAVMKQYPDTNTAQLASTKLAALGG